MNIIDRIDDTALNYLLRKYDEKNDTNIGSKVYTFFVEMKEAKFTSHNSDYAAALKCLDEFEDDKSEDKMTFFRDWLNERLNASHFA